LENFIANSEKNFLHFSSKLRYPKWQHCHLVAVLVIMTQLIPAWSRLVGSQ